MLVIHFCKNLPKRLGNFALFTDNFFTNAKLFKALKTLNIEASGTAKVSSGLPQGIVEIRAAATKGKDWGKIGLMTAKCNKRSNIEGDVLCMARVDVNTVQYMTTMHIIDEMKQVDFKPLEHRHGVHSNRGPLTCVIRCSQPQWLS